MPWPGSTLAASARPEGRGRSPGARRPSVAGAGQQGWPAATPKKSKGGGCCTLHTRAQGARRPPGRAQAVGETPAAVSPRRRAPEEGGEAGEGGDGSVEAGLTWRRNKKKKKRMKEKERKKKRKRERKERECDGDGDVRELNEGGVSPTWGRMGWSRLREKERKERLENNNIIIWLRKSTVPEKSPKIPGGRKRHPEE